MGPFGSVDTHPGVRSSAVDDLRCRSIVEGQLSIDVLEHTRELGARRLRRSLDLVQKVPGQVGPYLLGALFPHLQDPLQGPRLQMFLDGHPTQATRLGMGAQDTDSPSPVAHDGGCQAL